MKESFLGEYGEWRNGKENGQQYKLGEYGEWRVHWANYKRIQRDVYVFGI